MKSGSASFGPGAASGWYCTEKTGSVLCRSPSTVPSLRLISVTTAPAFSRDCGSAAKPWFCEVIETLPVSMFLTGWLPPRWPNFSLKVLGPEGVRDHLVPQTDAESRVVREQLPHGSVHIAQRGRVAGAVGEEDSIRGELLDLGGGGGGWKHGAVDLEAVADELAEDRVFRAEVEATLKRFSGIGNEPSEVPTGR